MLINSINLYTNSSYNSHITRPQRSNNVAFQGLGSMEAKYNAVAKDLTSYIMSPTLIDLKSIERIIQKYSPTTTVDNIANLATNRIITIATAGYTKKPIAFNPTTHEIVAMPKTIYLRQFNNQTRDDRILWLDNVLHETTHVLNEESDDRLSYVEFLKRNPNHSVRALQCTPNIFSQLESAFIQTFFGEMENIGSLPKPIPPSKANVDNLFFKTQGISGADFAACGLNYLMSGYGITDINDKNFILKSIISLAKGEKEAYSNALKSDKELLGLQGMTDFDVRIQGYDRIIEGAKKLIQ